MPKRSHASPHIDELSRLESNLEDWEDLIRRPLAVSAATLNHRNVGLSEGVDDVADTDEGALGRKALNGTAYRIFKLLQCLLEAPHSLDELNARFAADPRIGRAVSNDSVWLYVNTLKALGCRVRRPSPRNQFRYELLFHPFGLSLSEARQETLARAKAHAQKSFSHQEMLTLDRLFKKIIRHSDTDSPEACIDALFRQSRSFDLETCREHIRVLESGLQEERLFRFCYRSPRQGEEDFLFLPEMLYYERGVLYVRGDRADLPTPSSLRVDRLITVVPVDPTEEKAFAQDIRADILARRFQKTEVRLRVFAPDPKTWPGLGLDARHGVYAEIRQAVWDGVSAPFVEVTLQVRDFFYLKQRLLASGHLFHILSPRHFQRDVRETLSAMLQLYEAPVGSGAAAGYGA